MDPLTIGLIASGVLGLGGGLLSFFGAKKQSKTNQQIATQNQQAQLTENEITRLREDTAVQRAAADMEAAGLSKTLAAGNSASSQALTAPQLDFQQQNFGQAALQGISQGAQVAQQVASVQNTVAQTKHQELVNDNYVRKLNADIDVAKTQARLNSAEARLKEFEGEHQAEKYQYEIDKLISEIFKNNESGNFSKKEREYISQKIVNDIIRNEHVDAETQKLLVEIAKAKLDFNVLSYNYEWAQSNDLPVGVSNENLYNFLRRMDQRANQYGNNKFSFSEDAKKRYNIPDNIQFVI